mmetsp:Transcript_4080/g.10988  ORF Transcript_4080/g.10988 Transcript_4080/m.10988 type:complete len:250 (-) Transcript_4080:1950-2699(-)
MGEGGKEWGGTCAESRSCTAAVTEEGCQHRGAAVWEEGEVSGAGRPQLAAGHVAVLCTPWARAARPSLKACTASCVELSTPCPCSCCSRHASSRSRTSVSMPARCGAPHILPTTPPPPASASACGPSLWEAYGPEPQAPLQQLAANRGPGGLAARWRRPWMSPASARCWGSRGSTMQRAMRAVSSEGQRPAVASKWPSTAGTPAASVSASTVSGTCTPGASPASSRFKSSQEPASSACTPMLNATSCLL